MEPELKSVSDLYGRHDGEDIYVVGTGPSLRVFPTDFLSGRVTIGLNRAWNTVDCKYSITIHPGQCIPEFLPGELARPETTWITKHDKLAGLPDKDIKYAEETFHFFRTDGRPNTRTDGLSDSGRIRSWVEEPTANFLYLWGSVATCGVNLAANMGAKNIILVGCDNGPLLGNHHADSQPTNWLGHRPEDRYRQYYEGLAEVRAALRTRNVSVVSVTPFLTLGPHERDFLRLCQELGRPELVEQFDLFHPPSATPSTGRRAVRRLGRVLSSIAARNSGR